MDYHNSQKEFVNKMMDALWAAPSMCDTCNHKAVCKYTEENREKCDDYKHDPDYRRHGDIQELFQPIFDWMQRHYPAGGVSFYVDSISAKMQLDYGAKAFNKRVFENMCCCDTTPIVRETTDTK